MEGTIPMHEKKYEQVRALVAATLTILDGDFAAVGGTTLSPSRLQPKDQRAESSTTSKRRHPALCQSCHHPSSFHGAHPDSCRAIGCQCPRYARHDQQPIVVVVGTDGIPVADVVNAVFEAVRKQSAGTDR